MVDYIIIKFPLIILVFILSLAIIKLVLYVKFKSVNDTFRFFFYYPSVNIVLTSKWKRKRIKEAQNFLSTAIVLLLLFFTIIMLVLKM